ncbi:MAG: TrmH family RNA methyltransferase [Ilumatobacteraceae bacterium]
MSEVEPARIESLDDPRISDYVGLRDRKESDDFLIAESAIVVERLMTSRFSIRSYFFTPKGWERMKDAVIENPRYAPVYIAEPEVMEAVTGFDLHRGILASASRRGWPTLPDVVGRATRLIVLEGSNDHENIGVVARSARALGFDGMLLSPNCADPYYRRCIRVSMGEILHLPITRVANWPDGLAYLVKQGFELWALTPDAGAESLFRMGMPEKVALVAGAEGPGLTAEAKARTHYDVRIPMHHGVDSLNLGHALAIAMAAVSPAVSD